MLATIAGLAVGFVALEAGAVSLLTPKRDDAVVVTSFTLQEGQTPASEALAPGDPAALDATVAPAAEAQARLAEAPKPVPSAPSAAPVAGVSASSVDRWIGAYMPGAPSSVGPMSAFESRTGAKLAVSLYFQNTSQGFTKTAAANAAAHGSTPLITLEFWDPARGVTQPSYSLKAISGGRWDAYLREYARDAKAFGKTVWLRPMHEMNGNWYPWGGTVNGNTPADFVPAWKHIVAIFRAEGAKNVKFVWAPNTDSVPGGSSNAIARYWPGDGYVDYVALDGYNFGSPWRSFGSVFGSGYGAVTALTSKPLFIAETACSANGDKAAWVANMFDVIPSKYPRIVGVNWFDVKKERDWRVGSSAACLAAFKSGVATF